MPKAFVTVTTNDCSGAARWRSTRHCVNQAPPAPWLDAIALTRRKVFAGPITNAFSLMATLEPTFRFRKVGGVGTIAHDGYRYVPVPLELRHLTKSAPWVGEHRLVMARQLGRALASDEQVHHINGDRSDNALGNLELWSTSHPSGRRVEDLLEFCLAMLDRYGDQFGLFDQHQGPSERSLS
jgi:HNH endonuclease